MPEEENTMKKRTVTAMLIAIVMSAGVAVAGDAQVVHTVYFTLKDDTPENRAALVASCHEHLQGHEGTLYFAVSTLAEDMQGQANDSEFDVALNLVFEDTAALQAYSKNPRHLSFIRENMPTWAKVRVFDSYVAQADE
jgi:quinol monooxygenase YgiN